MLDIIVLAAGKGTRMRSSKPKVLHSLAAKPMVCHVLDRARELQSDNIMLVVGHGADQVRLALDGELLTYVEQRDQLGTGHAVMQALPYLRDGAVSLILYGDVPLIKTETLRHLIEQVSPCSIGLLTVTLDDASGYGRIVRNGQGDVESIVEQKDATDEQLKISEANTGVLAVDNTLLRNWLPRLSNDNAQGEYYLTDIIGLATSEGIAVKTAQPANALEVLGVNNRNQQAQLERALQLEIAQQALTDGLSLKDPARFDCRGTFTFGEDCEVDINCVFEGKVILGDRVSIGPNCILKNSRVGSDTVIDANSVLEDTTVGEACSIGPFARLRPGTRLERKAKIGNFVETKKASIGRGSKVNHLSYVGDADVGDDVNIGAGTITCNYDGANKFKTVLEDGVFVGSNSALVAPVTLSRNSTIGAGSVVTKDSQEGELVLARAKQKNISGWKRPQKKK